MFYFIYKLYKIFSLNLTVDIFQLSLMAVMITFNYNLDRNPNAKNGNSIIIVLYDKRIPPPHNKLRLSTGWKVPAANWNAKEQIVRKNHRLSYEINNMLDNLKNEIQKIIANCFTENYNVSLFDVMQKVRENLKPESAQILSSIDIYFKYLENKTKKSSMVQTVSAIKIIKGILRNIDSKITFNDINHTFLDRFLLELSNGRNNNRVLALFSFFKSYCNWCKKRDLHNNNIFEKYEPSIKKYTANSNALTMDELQILENAEIKDDNTFLKIALDMFLFQCYTGQGYSEIRNFNINQVQGDVWIIKRGKTQKKLEIPLNQKAIQILSAYKYELNKYIFPITKQNIQLKRLFKLLKLDRTVTVSKRHKGNIIDVEKRLYEVISTHAARHTFVSIACYNNISNNVIKSITGHSGDNMINKYFNKNIEQTKNATKDLFK